MGKITVKGRATRQVPYDMMEMTIVFQGVSAKRTKSINESITQRGSIFRNMQGTINSGGNIYC